MALASSLRSHAIAILCHPLPAKVLGRNFTLYNKSHAGTRNAKVFPLPVFAAARTLGLGQGWLANDWVSWYIMGRSLKWWARKLSSKPNGLGVPQLRNPHLFSTVDAPVAAGERTKNQIFWAHVFQDEWHPCR